MNNSVLEHNIIMGPERMPKYKAQLWLYLASLLDE